MAYQLNMKQLVFKITSVVTLLLAFLLVLITPLKVLAANYGDGNYGVGDYNVGNTPTPVPAVPNTEASASVCSSTQPTGNSPWIYSASSGDGNSATLKFVNYQTPITHFVIEYGTKSGEYNYSVDNISKDTTSYTVNKLNAGTTYYFRIRSGNDCAVGTWSNEISTQTKGSISFNQLDFTEFELIPSSDDDSTSSKNNSCETYTVESGDTLWKISADLLGDGSRYKEIIDANKDTYTSLKTSNSLKAGWELKVGCDSSKIGTGDDGSKTGGYIVNVKVINQKLEPIKGATVTLHSDPKETTTDESGVARFTNVEAGDHKILIAYNNFKGEQSINLSGNTKEFNLNITVTEQKVMFSRTAWIVMGIMSLVIVSLLFFRFKKK